MKTIICLLVLIAGAFWFFHGRALRTTPAPLRDAAAEVATQTKAAIANAQAAASVMIHSPPAHTEPSAQQRLLAGEKLREQRVSPPQQPQPIGATPYDKILRCEKIGENRRAAAQ